MARTKKDDLPVKEEELTEDEKKKTCPSSKHLGHLSLFLNGGSGSSRFDVKPLVVDGSSGGFGW